MGRLELLLKQKEPLEAHEITSLTEWLAALKSDIATFGNTPEDDDRMKAIRDRLGREKNRKAKP